MDEQRSLSQTDPKSDRSIFVENASRWLSAAGVSLENFDHKVWGTWVYTNPKRCPALALQFQVLREIVRNIGDTPKQSDIPDLAYVPAIPYVDAATMDRRMCNYIKQACNVLRALNPKIDYDKRLFKDIRALLNQT